MTADPHLLPKEIQDWPDGPLWDSALRIIARDGVLFREIEEALADRDMTTAELVTQFLPNFGFFITWPEGIWSEQVERRLIVLRRLGRVMKWGDTYQLAPKRTSESLAGEMSALGAVQTETPSEAAAVELLRGFERRLRRYLERRLRTAYNDRWWERGIPEDVQKAATDERLGRSPAERGADSRNLEFLTWSHYKDLTLWKKNWSRIFERDFRDKSKVSVYLSGLANARNALFHVRGISPDAVNAIPYMVGELDSSIK